MIYDIKLHVVYAGRGGAMVLDYTVSDNRQLIIVDGGPQGKDHLTTELASYHKYLATALREI